MLQNVDFHKPIKFMYHSKEPFFLIKQVISSIHATSIHNLAAIIKFKIQNTLFLFLIPRQVSCSNCNFYLYIFYFHGISWRNLHIKPFLNFSNSYTTLPSILKTNTNLVYISQKYTYLIFIFKGEGGFSEHL